MQSRKESSIDWKTVSIAALTAALALTVAAAAFITANSCDILGHHLQVGADSPPGCSKEGMTRTVSCLKCGREIVKADTVPATGHDWKIADIGTQNRYICTLCGAEKLEYNADELAKENDSLKTRVSQLETELEKYTQVTRTVPENYVPQRIEAPAPNEVIIHGDTDASGGQWIQEAHSGHLSSVCMPGTDIQYTILDEKVKNCCGVKITYSTQLRSGTSSGERYFYVCEDLNSGTWIQVGTFFYDGSGREQEISIDFDRYADFEAFCTPRVYPNNSSFGVVQNITYVKR